MERSKLGWIVSVAAVAACAVPSAWADHGRGRWDRDGRDNRYRNRGDVDYARVVHVEPILRRIRISEPRRECWQETRYEEPQRYRDRAPRPAAGSMILGGVLGAAVGNQIGSGDGRRAATVAGALIGSALGHDAAARRDYDDRRYDSHNAPTAYNVERCDVRYEDRWDERVDGYRVTYVYRGREYQTRLPYDPGDRLRVRVDVDPEPC